MIPLEGLTTEDEILSLIRKGESKRVEFKETFSKNTHTQKRDKEIEKSSLKNIVGFLNSTILLLVVFTALSVLDVKGIQTFIYMK